MLLVVSFPSFWSPLSRECLNSTVWGWPCEFPSDQSEKVRRSFCDSARIQRDTSGLILLVFRSSRARLNDFSFVDGPQYGARLERERTVRAWGGERGKGDGRSKMKKKKKTKAALKRKVGARIETQFDPRYEAPAEVGSPRAHLTWMRWQPLSDMFSCTRALAPSLIAYIMRSPRARGAFLDLSSSLPLLAAYFQRGTHSAFLKLDIDYSVSRDTIRGRDFVTNRSRAVDFEQAAAHEMPDTRSLIRSCVYNNKTYNFMITQRNRNFKWVKKCLKYLTFNFKIYFLRFYSFTPVWSITVERCDRKK